MTRYDFSALQTATGLNVSEIARRTGADRATLQRWKREGLTDEAADRLSCALGLVPYLVWDGYLADGLDAFDDLQRRKRYAATKRWRRRHPAKAKAIQAEWQKRYYAENADRIRARQRAYYEANRERELERKRRSRKQAS